MLCPHCQTETLGVGGHCSICHKPLLQRAPVATGVDTPPPSDIADRSNPDLTRPPRTIAPAEPERERGGAVYELTQLATVSTGGGRGTGAVSLPVTAGPLESGQAFG